MARAPKFTTAQVGPASWTVNTGALRPSGPYFGWRPVLKVGLFSDEFLAGTAHGTLTWPGAGGEHPIVVVGDRNGPEGINFAEPRRHRELFWKMVADLGVGTHEEVVLTGLGRDRMRIEPRHGLVAEVTPVAPSPASVERNVPVPETATTEPWAAATATRLLAIDRPHGRSRVTPAQVMSMLSVLGAFDRTALSLTRLAELAGLPPARVGRYVSQLQALVNIDGYEALTVSGDAVRFDRTLLERQLGQA